MAEAEREREQRQSAAARSGDTGSARGGARDAGSRFGAFHRGARQSGNGVTDTSGDGNTGTSGNGVTGTPEAASPARPAPATAPSRPRLPSPTPSRTGAAPGPVRRPGRRRPFPLEHVR